MTPTVPAPGIAVPHAFEPNAHDRGYLLTKARCSGHLLDPGPSRIERVRSGRPEISPTGTRDVVSGGWEDGPEEHVRSRGWR
jgi:hypothetical protein